LNAHRAETGAGDRSPQPRFDVELVLDRGRWRHIKCGLQAHAHWRRRGVLLAPATTRIAHLVEVFDHHVHHAARAAATGKAVKSRANIFRVATDKAFFLEPLARGLS
jgi:hypothetical protein